MQKGKPWKGWQTGESGDLCPGMPWWGFAWDRIVEKRQWSCPQLSLLWGDVSQFHPFLNSKRISSSAQWTPTLACSTNISNSNYFNSSSPSAWLLPVLLPSKSPSFLYSVTSVTKSTILLPYFRHHYLFLNSFNLLTPVPTLILLQYHSTPLPFKSSYSTLHTENYSTISWLGHQHIKPF